MMAALAHRRKKESRQIDRKCSRLYLSKRLSCAARQSTARTNRRGLTQRLRIIRAHTPEHPGALSVSTGQSAIIRIIGENICRILPADEHRYPVEDIHRAPGDNLRASTAESHIPYEIHR